jgi:M6 family metalloprotease-like protein
MKYFLVVLNLLFVLGSSSAQNFIKKVRPFSSPNVSKVSAQSDTLKILAVMVEFQADRDGTTFGNGKFGSIYSQDYGQNILDPLPHNKPYFESHLLFAKNYFQKVSNGKLVIQYTVLPGILTVSKTMRNYSPPSNSTDYTLLGNFCNEVWQLADSANPGFDFSQYNVFTIFHAGAGRDVVIPGTLGNEHNIPSLYLGEKSFKNIYGNSFDGFPVQNNFKITNTIVMPETESREISNGLTTSFLQLTINGLMVANIGSAIGLPDLYNTSTGESAIGRFGLMDGQSFFAYSGLFPPEPSPWTKIYMGWADVVTVDPGNYRDIKVFAKLAAAASDTVILKIPINSKEYFLVENRNRDAHKNGEIVTYNSNGVTLTKSFSEDVDNFNNYDVSAINGVVTDVDEFDWAVPGNGIVIWHVDENIINNNFASNSINAGTTRGVYVEEADGIQDIGQQFTDIFGDQIVGEGSPEDFWFKSNPSEFFTNKFSKDTRPNTNANSGANSLITISDFSDTANAMTFNVSYGDSIIKNIFSRKVVSSNFTSKLSVLQNDNDFEFGLISNSNLFIYGEDGNPVDSFPSFSKFKPVTYTSLGTTYFVGSDSTRLNFYANQAGQVLTSRLWLVSEATSAPVLISLQGEHYNAMIGCTNGKIYTYTMPSFGSPNLIDSIYISSKPITKIAVDDSHYSVISGNMMYDSDGNSVDLGSVGWDIALTKNSSGKYISVVSVKGRILIISEGKIQTEYDIENDRWPDSQTSFSIVDLKNDGNNYVIFPENNKIVAKNINGASADNFSFTDPLGVNFSGVPLAADFEGDSKPEIIAATTDGRIFAIDGGSGKVVNGFPLSVGDSLSSIPVVFENNGQLSLVATTYDNNFYSWVISSVAGKQFWSSENGDNLNSSFVNVASQKNYISEYFPPDRAYNYPNPVYGNTTNIRYYVSEDSRINIKIFDIAGSFVDELNDFATGGLDHETVWNVGRVQSGIYLARILATSTNGKSESKIIKIAVVK